MLKHPTLDKLHALKLTGMAAALAKLSELRERFSTITVADTGEGIAPEHLDHLFDRFYRADTVRDRRHGGSGIGLTITRALVEAHHGRIRAHSDGPGRGARFTIELPVIAV